MALNEKSQDLGVSVQPTSRKKIMIKKKSSIKENISCPSLPTIQTKQSIQPIHIVDTFSKCKLESLLKDYKIKYTPTATIDDLKVLCKMKIYNINMTTELSNMKIKNRAEFRIYNFILNCYLKSLGNGYQALKACCLNEEDIGTGNLINEIPTTFILIEEDNGYYYGFDIRSLLVYNGIKSRSSILSESRLNGSTNFCSNHTNVTDNSKALINPYTKANFSDSFLHTYTNKLAFLIRNNWPLEHRQTELSVEQQQRIRILDLFQKINHLGFYVKHEWFMDLSYKKYIKLYIGIQRTLSYLNNSTKTKVIRSNIFNQRELMVKLFGQKETDANKNLIIDILIKDLDKLVTEGITTADKINGTLWFLSVFVKISPDAHEHLSYLFV